MRSLNLIGKSLIVLLTLVLLSPPLCHANCTCSMGANGVKVVGLEMIATQCPATPPSEYQTYTYLINPVHCDGAKLYKFTSYGDVTASPAALINYYVGSGYRVLRNTSGTHLIAVQKGTYPFSGFVSGVNMASAAPGVYLTTPATLMDQYCTEKPVPDQDQDGIPDCLELPELDIQRNLGPGPCMTYTK